MQIACQSRGAVILTSTQLCAAVVRADRADLISRLYRGSILATLTRTEEARNHDNGRGLGYAIGPRAHVARPPPPARGALVSNYNLHTTFLLCVLVAYL